MRRTSPRGAASASRRRSSRATWPSWKSCRTRRRIAWPSTGSRTTLRYAQKRWSCRASFTRSSKPQTRRAARGAALLGFRSSNLRKFAALRREELPRDLVFLVARRRARIDVAGPPLAAVLDPRLHGGRRHAQQHHGSAARRGEHVVAVARQHDALVLVQHDHVVERIAERRLAVQHEEEVVLGLVGVQDVLAALGVDLDR